MQKVIRQSSSSPTPTVSSFSFRMRATKVLIEALTFKVEADLLAFGDARVFRAECEIEGIAQFYVSHFMIYFLDDEGIAISKQYQAIVSCSSAIPFPLNDSPLRPNYIEDFDITLGGPFVWGGVRHRADQILEADSN